MKRRSFILGALFAPAVIPTIAATPTADAPSNNQEISPASVNNAFREMMEMMADEARCRFEAAEPLAFSLDCSGPR